MSASVVFFDLETTGLKPDCDVLQIAAKCGDLRFNKYMLPRCPIEPGAADVNGFSVENGRLYQRGTLVETTRREDVANEFLNFLRSCGCTNSTVLVAHNAFNFDSRHLMRIFQEVEKLDQLMSVCGGGLSDTLPLLRAQLPNLGSHRLPILVRRFCPELETNLHGAVEDVAALERVCFLAGITHDSIISSAKSWVDMHY